MMPAQLPTKQVRFVSRGNWLPSQLGEGPLVLRRRVSTTLLFSPINLIRRLPGVNYDLMLFVYFCTKGPNVNVRLDFRYVTLEIVYCRIQKKRPN